MGQRTESDVIRIATDNQQWLLDQAACTGLSTGKVVNACIRLIRDAQKHTSNTDNLRKAIFENAR